MPILTSWPLNKAVWKRYSGSRRSQPERSAGACSGCARLPDWDAKIANLSGGERRRVRCAACCWKNQTCCCSTNRPTPGCRIRGLAGTLPARLRRHVVAITHDRYFLDNVAGWILDWTAVKVYRGKATTPPGWSRRSTSGAGSFTRSCAS